MDELGMTWIDIALAGIFLLGFAFVLWRLKWQRDDYNERFMKQSDDFDKELHEIAVEVKELEERTPRYKKLGREAILTTPGGEEIHRYKTKAK